MTKESDCYLTKDADNKPACAPRASTINFIRQFSKAYVAVAGVALNGFVCN